MGAPLGDLVPDAGERDEEGVLTLRVGVVGDATGVGVENSGAPSAAASDGWPCERKLMNCICKGKGGEERVVCDLYTVRGKSSW